MAGYIGTSGETPRATQTRDSFTCVGGETSFATGGYSVNYVDVFLNGIKMQIGTDVIATNGSDVVFASACSASDIVEVIAYKTFEVAGAVGGGLFKGENGTTGTSAGDIFRVNEQQLDTDVEITATENASATGPLTVASGTTLTVNGNLVII
tara:strand:- start:1967 stop:2422 length:456 start_codon:yes stop_codon:yes gene_type:complete